MALNDFLNPYPPNIQEIVRSLRALILDNYPRAVEQVDLPSKLIAYGIGTGYSETIFTIMPYSGWVNLGFYRAVELPDPQGLLEGTGKLHRHVKISKVEEVKNPALLGLIKAALDKKLNMK